MMLASGQLYRLYKKEDFGVELERIYENDDYVIGCHGTSYIPNGDFIDDDMVFKKGLRKPIRGDTSGSIKFTVACNIPFLELLYGNMVKMDLSILILNILLESISSIVIKQLLLKIPIQ